MATNNYSNASPSFSARQQNSQYSPYVSPSLRQQGQRFNYHAPSPYPRPRSSASKPNPSVSADNVNFKVNVDSCAVTAGDYYFRSDQLFNNSYGSSPNGNSNRFNNYTSAEFSSPGSEYYSCNEDSFVSPMSSASAYANYPNTGFTATQSQQQFSPYLDGSFPGTPSRQLGNYQVSGYLGSSPVQQQSPKLFGQRKFSQGKKNGVPAAQKRGATSGFSYEGNSTGDDGTAGQSLAPKKPKASVHCDICNIDFTSDIPYKMHLAGAKHLKKLKSNELLKTMETQGQVPQSKDNYFYCEHCQIMANSSQQLQMHLEGTKHKNKMRKLAEDGVNVAGVLQNDTESAGDTGPKPAKMSKFYCDVCSLVLNSEIQMSQHLTSKKHEAKVKGEPLPPKKKIRKFTDEPTNGSETVASTETTSNTASGLNANVPASSGVQGLESSFVPGGVLK